MQSGHGFWRSSFQLVLVASLFTACGGDATTPQPDAGVQPPAIAPSVVVTGEFLVPMRTTTKLLAQTVNGADTGYDWVSSDVAVASVAEDGTVRGLAPGKSIITATGKTTGKAGVFNLVVAADVPYLAEWAKSGHADATSEAFVHWDHEEVPEVPASCAKCHSSDGFKDFIGHDGSTPDKVDVAARIGTTVECSTCHNSTASDLDHVVFPSGVKLEGLGPEARCMTCHQGRESKDSVDKAIVAAAAADDDTVSDKLSFRNVHYYAAGATLNAGTVRGGYQYEGQAYDTRFRHVPGYETCAGCHDPHSLEVKVDECATCHAGVESVEDLRDIRMIASRVADYDGDGDKVEGVAREIDGLREKLWVSMQRYTTARGISGLCYDSHAHPYFFKDIDGDGACSAAEAVSANRPAFTNRLLRAAYNYQVSLKDPGAFAHNAKYIIQLLHDSIADLHKAGGMVAVDMSQARRTDPGHFDGAGEPARHWDAEGDVAAGCAKCHAGSDGLRFYLAFGTNIKTEPHNGADCATCHDGFGTKAEDFTLLNVPSVTFPSGVVVKPDAVVTSKSFACMTCHSGREAKSTIDATIAGGRFSFRNVHYLPAGAVLYGNDAKVGYQYDGKTYAGRFTHSGGTDCVSCHNAKNTEHSFAVEDNLAQCKLCHAGATEVQDIRLFSRADYDGDGKCQDREKCATSETLPDELHGLADALMAQLQSVAAICYSSASYPYWFKDLNGDKQCAGDELKSSNGFAPWTPALMKAAHNYQINVKEHGAWAHNFKYTAQLLIDATADLGGDVSRFTRP